MCMHMCTTTGLSPTSTMYAQMYIMLHWIIISNNYKIIIIMHECMMESAREKEHTPVIMYSLLTLLLYVHV